MSYIFIKEKPRHITPLYFTKNNHTDRFWHRCWLTVFTLKRNKVYVKWKKLKIFKILLNIVNSRFELLVMGFNIFSFSERNFPNLVHTTNPSSRGTGNCKKNCKIITKNFYNLKDFDQTRGVKPNKKGNSIKIVGSQMKEKNRHFWHILEVNDYWKEIKLKKWNG